MLELPLEFLTQWEGYVDAVTPEQMQAAAKAVLQPQQSVTGMLLPKKASMEAPDETH
jgi:zinc protease